MPESACIYLQMNNDNGRSWDLSPHVLIHLKQIYWLTKAWRKKVRSGHIQSIQGNLKLEGSVQRVSKSRQKVKFNHYKKTDSCRVKGWVRSYSIYIRKSKAGSESGKSLKPRAKSSIQLV